MIFIIIIVMIATIISNKNNTTYSIFSLAHHPSKYFGRTSEPMRTFYYFSILCSLSILAYANTLSLSHSFLPLIRSRTITFYNCIGTREIVPRSLQTTRTFSFTHSHPVTHLFAHSFIFTFLLTHTLLSLTYKF
jgi:hypothetical protein